MKCSAVCHGRHGRLSLWDLFYRRFVKIFGYPKCFVFQSTMETDGKVEEMNHLQALIAAEEEKEKSFKAENIRRRHNYIPFIVELLKVLAKEGKLVPLVQEVFCVFVFLFMY